MKQPNFTSIDFSQVPCILCGETRTRLLSPKGQFGIPTYVSICPNDGLVYLNPRWTKSRYMDFYNKEYDKYYRPEVFNNESDKYKHIEQIWNRLLQYYSKVRTDSVLDIGAGMGWSLEWIKSNKSDISLAAIEASEHCKNNITNFVGAELLTQDLDDDWHIGRKGKYGLIIMRHVLEHVLDPINVLKKVEYVLATDGILYLAVPDMMSPTGSLENHWYRVVHTYYFSAPVLKHIVGKAGLYPVSFHAEYHELWGVFQKGTVDVEENLKPVYYQQMKIIHQYQILAPMRWVIASIRRVKNKFRKILY